MPAGRAGDPPTGTGPGNVPRTWLLRAPGAAAVRSGRSPDGTGQWPVPPKTGFSNELQFADAPLVPAGRGFENSL